MQVDFDQFLLALSKMADKRGQSLAEVVRGVLLAGGPTVNSTKASYIKFHDDKVPILTAASFMHCLDMAAQELGLGFGSMPALARQTVILRMTSRMAHR